MRKVNRRTITDKLSLFKILPLDGFNPIRVKQRLHMRRKKFVKVLGTVTQAKTFWYVQFIGVWKFLWRSIMESSNNNTSSIRDKWHRRKSSAQSKWRCVCSIATIRSGWELVGRFYGMLHFSARCPRHGSKTSYARRFGEPFKGPVIPFRAMVEYYQISARDHSRPHQFGKKFLPGLFLGHAWIAAEFGKEFFWLQTLRIWKHGCIGNPSSTTQREEIFMFPEADGTPQVSGRDQKIREPEQPVGSEDLSGELQGEPEGKKNRQNQKIPLKPQETIGRFKVTSSIVITVNLEFNSTCRKKKHSLIHWNTLM